MTFNNKRYWRDRMMDKLVSQNNQRSIDLEDLLDNVRHIGEDINKFDKALNMIKAGYIELEKAIMLIKLK